MKEIVLYGVELNYGRKINLKKDSMQFEKGDNIEERIDNAFVMFYFNLCSGDYSVGYCIAELKRQEILEEYEICEGIKKALNFKEYGDKFV
tara:strand:+ start:839 stop:1111 length:273 start_codon:yes stop_codon:yes gene_type:complete